MNLSNGLLNNKDHVNNWFNYNKIKKRNISLIGVIVIIIITLLGIYIYNLHNKNKYSILKNQGDKYFLDLQYDNAIKEYNSMYIKDKNSLWQAKIAQIYSIKGDLLSSKKYIEKAKESKHINSLAVNHIIFTEVMNKDYYEALQDGEKFLEKCNDKNLIKTMIPVYIYNKKYNKAEKLLRDYKVNNKSAYDMAEYAQMLITLGNTDDAFKYLKKAWDLDKEEYKIYDVLNQNYLYNKKQLTETLLSLRNNSPQEPAYKVWIAKIYSNNKNTADEANEIMNTLSKKDIGKIQKDVIQAAICEHTNNREKADEIINKLLKDNKNDYRILHTAAWHYLNKKDYHKALEYCEKSIYKNEMYVDNFGFLMPEILKAKGEFEKANPYFQVALSREPFNTEIMRNMGNYYLYDKSNYKKSEEYFKMASVIKPKDAEIKYNLALIYMDNKDKDKAISELNKCITLRNDISRYHRTLGTIYFLQGKTDYSIKEMNLAYDIDENDPLILNNLGCYYIMVTTDLEKGFKKLKLAHNYINITHDDNYKKVIKENYKKGKKLLMSYKKASGDTKLKIPDFTMFY